MVKMKKVYHRVIATRLPVFSKKAQRKTIVHPKFYYFDVGVYRHLRPRDPLDTPELIGGVALETLVYQELRAIIEYYRLDFTLYFWRTVDQVEVDFILYGPKGLIAIEVKSSKTIHPSDLRPLQIFKEKYPIAKLYLFYCGKDPIHRGDVEILPLSTALSQLNQYIS